MALENFRAEFVVVVVVLMHFPVKTLEDKRITI